MSEFSKLHGYDVKDKTARDSILEINQSISELNNDIDTINENLNVINEKKYIFIGDSYNTDDTPTGGTQIIPWSSLLVNYLGLNNDDYYSSGVSGAGWSVSNNKFITQLQVLSENITNKNEITDIYVLGGINDNPNSPSDVYNDILDFSEYAANFYPNAMVTIGIISWATYLQSKLSLLMKMSYYNNANIKPNIRFISNAYTWFHIYSQYQEDGHPTASGSITIACNLANYIKGGIANNNLYYSGNIYRDNNNIGISSSQSTIGTIKQYLNNENVNLMISIDNLTLNNSSITTAVTTPYILGSFDNLFIKTDNEILPIYSGSCWGYDTSSASYINMNYTLLVQNNSLKIMFNYVDKTAGNKTFNFSIIAFDKIPIINIPLVFC